MEVSSNVGPSDLAALLAAYLRDKKLKRLPSDKRLMRRVSLACLGLFERDYEVHIFQNDGGSAFGLNYPPLLVVPVRQRAVSPLAAAWLDANCAAQETWLAVDPHSIDADAAPVRIAPTALARARSRSAVLDALAVPVATVERFGRLAPQCRNARVRGRAVAPALLAFGKLVCRSGSLSIDAENLFRGIAARFHSHDQYPALGARALREQDNELLRTLRVDTVFNLMTERRKKKFGIEVCDSELADRFNTYGSLRLCAVPFPGTEFFPRFGRVRCGLGLQVTWSDDADVSLCLPASIPSLNPRQSWLSYQSWDVVTLAQNYLHALVSLLLSHKTSGLLVHCVSGWDRTPMFVTLLRLSLWADGEAHASLSPFEMLYLTVAYDWLQFGHQLGDRASRKEEIMYFTFYLLPFLAGREFSVHSHDVAASPAMHPSAPPSSSQAAAPTSPVAVAQPRSEAAAAAAAASSSLSAALAAEHAALPPLAPHPHPHSHHLHHHAQPSALSSLDALASLEAPSNASGASPRSRSDSTASSSAGSIPIARDASSGRRASIDDQFGSWQDVSALGSTPPSARTDSRLSPPPAAGPPPPPLSFDALIARRAQRLTEVARLFAELYLPLVPQPAPPPYPAAWMHGRAAGDAPPPSSV